MPSTQGPASRPISSTPSPPLHHRSPGPVLALLDDPRVTLELVADGLHVHPDLVGHVIATAGARRVALVTDAMAAAGEPDGRYRLGALDVRVTDGTARLDDGTIAGSTASMSTSHRTASRVTDMARASRVASATPAAALGLTDVGSISVGLRADLVVLADDESVVGVLRGGRWLTEPAG